MKIYFSAQTRGFYQDDVHEPAAIPVDAKEITQEERAAMLEANSEGKIVTGGTDGKPVASDHEPLSDEQVKVNLKAEIAAMEIGNLMPRATREFMLLFMESQGKPEQLAKNIGYVKVKAFDEQIIALRKLL